MQIIKYNTSVYRNRTPIDMIQLEEILMDYMNNLDSNYIFIEKISNIIKSYENVSEDNIELLLDHLEYNGHLHNLDMILRVCPLCISNISKCECQECGSHIIIRVRKIMHRCGYLDHVNAFFKGDELECPNCMEQIQFGSDDEYRFTDSIYKCHKCNSIVSKYAKLDGEMNCNKCGTDYRNTESKFIHPYSKKSI